MKDNLNINKKYLKIVGIIIAALIALSGVGFIILNFFYNGMFIKENKDELASIPKYTRNESEVEGDINQNIAIFGVDKDEMRTDVIFVVNLNSETNEIKIISVPRDTKVKWTEFQQQKMAELDKGYHEYSKITEMSAYGGIDNLRYFTINTLEDIMGIQIDHYAVVNIEAFRKVVDAIGGVEVDVPRRMEYNDNYQDLHIDLQPGLQLLNGEQAEGLVRWRHNEDYSEQYAEGDVGRIETQQLFLRALAQKLFSTDTTGQLLKIANAVYSDIKTDIKFSELKNYMAYATQFQLNNITFATLPGEAVREDKWYYILDQAQIDAFMQKILYNREVPVADTENESSEEGSTTAQMPRYKVDESKEINKTQEILKTEEDEVKQSVEVSSPSQESITPSPTSEDENATINGEVVNGILSDEGMQEEREIVESTPSFDEVVTPTPSEEVSQMEESSGANEQVETEQPLVEEA